MAEYIKRQTVFDSLPTVTEDKTISLYGAVADFMVLVSAIPAADVVEVVHGRWELHGNDDDCGCSYFCSRCGFNIDEEVFERLDSTDHCNRCGARMDGDA